MRTYLLLAALAFTGNVFGQVTPGKKLAQVTASSPVTVSYVKANDTSQIHGNPKYYINGINYGSAGAVFNADNIEAIDVEKEDSKILITLKTGYKPSFITLDQLKKKYVDSKNPAAIYILDGNLVTNNLQMIDENYVMNIKVYRPANMTYLKDQVNSVDIINISSKSKANLEKANAIYIRGNSEMGK
jgi:hypothetical protein